MQQAQRDHLSRTDIADRALAMLTAVFGDSINLLEPAPIEKLIEIFQTNGWLTFCHDDDLGILPGGRVIYGEFNVEPMRIRISPKLKTSTPRFRFTLAHEIGHFVLHRKLIGKGLYINREQMPSDGASELKYREMATLSDLGWVEWQANEFALALLLPTVTLFQKIQKIQQGLGINRNFGIIYFDDQPINQADASQIIVALEREFDVPKALLWRRLRHLNLLQDRRTKRIKMAYDSIGALFHSQKNNSG